MPTVKYDVSDVEYGGTGGDSDWGGTGYQPKPGIVNAFVVRSKPRKEKKDGTKLDKPDIEWVFEVEETPGRPEAALEAGAWLALYTKATLKDDSWSLANVLEALGIATESKRSGSFDTDKQLKKHIRLRVVADKGGNSQYNPENEYRARISRVMAPVSATGAAPARGEETPAAGPNEPEDEPPF